MSVKSIGVEERSIEHITYMKVAPVERLSNSCKTIGLSEHAEVKISWQQSRCIQGSVAFMGKIPDFSANVY